MLTRSVARNLNKLSIYANGRQTPSTQTSIRYVQTATAVDPNESAVPKPFNKIPGGISKLPVIGMFYSALDNILRPGRYHHVFKSFAKYGPIYRERIGPKDFVFINDVEAVAKLHKTEVKYPQRVILEPWREWREEKGYEKGVLVEHGNETWKMMRTVLDRQLMLPSHVATYTDGVNQVAHAAVKRLRRLRDERGRIASLDHQMFSWSLETIGTVLLERRFGGLDDNREPQVESFIRAVQKLFQTTASAMILPRKLAKKLIPGRMKAHDDAWQAVFDIVKPLVDQRLEEVEKPQSGSKEHQGFLSTLLATNKLSRGQLYANLSELMLAAVDTTSNTMMWSLYELSQHPHVQDAILEEAKVVISDLDNPTYNEMHRLTVVRGVIRESLRLYPLTTVLTRTYHEDIELCGYNIPAGTCIFPSLLALGRDPDHFPDPDSFKPERWQRDTGEEKINPYAWLPFGHGARSCIGRRVAELELRALLVQLVRNYKMSFDSDKKITPKLEGLLVPERVPEVRFMDRS